MFCVSNTVYSEMWLLFHCSVKNKKFRNNNTSLHKFWKFIFMFPYTCLLIMYMYCKKCVKNVCLCFTGNVHGPGLPQVCPIS